MTDAFVLRWQFQPQLEARPREWHFTYGDVEIDAPSIIESPLKYPRWLTRSFFAAAVIGIAGLAVLVVALIANDVITAIVSAGTIGAALFGLSLTLRIAEGFRRSERP